MADLGQVLVVEQGQLQGAVIGRQLAHRVVAQGADPVQPLDRAQLLLDAG